MASEQNHGKRLKLSPLHRIHTAEYDMDRQMQLIAERYHAEEALLAAIANGEENAAFAAFRSYSDLMADPEQEARPTSSNPIRDFKNSVLVMNTLFRKAIERNYVHPIYIHESSSYFGAVIEQANAEKDLYQIIREMVHVYCELVKECSVASYSTVVRNAILYIDLHLSSPISTRDLASEQFLSPNYLSTRFKQEVGSSISDYILSRRMKRACRLLTTTQASIQEIAAQCGMDDASYFSRQFKRAIGIAPLQFRKNSRS